MSQADRPVVLVMPRHMTSWAELRLLSNWLQKNGSVQPVYVLANQAMAAKACECHAAGYETIDLFTPITRKLTGLSAPYRWITECDPRLEAHPRLGNLLPVALWRAEAFRQRLRIEYAVMIEAIKRTRPIAILMPGDRELSPVPPMLRAAADCGVPTIIAATSLPYIEGISVGRAGSPAHRARWRDGAPLLNVLAARRFPRQCRDTEHGRMIFSPGWRTLALSGENMLSPNPWAQGAGQSTFILQHSRKKAQLSAGLGVPRDKMLLVGDPTFDPLYRTFKRRDEIRRHIQEAHGLDDRLPLVVMSVPTEAEHDLCDWPTHLRRQEAWWQVLAEQPANVLLSLHPKSRRQDYEELAGRCGFHFATQLLADLLPAADLFVCSGSTTVQWAKMCGVPAINMDYLRLKMDYFKEPCGLSEVYEPEEFAAALPASLAYSSSTDWAYFQAHAAALRDDSMFDGNACQRVDHVLALLAREGVDAARRQYAGCP